MKIICKRCKKYFPGNLDNFHACKSKKNGLSTYCKGCYAELNKINREKVKRKRQNLLNDNDRLKDVLNLAV